MGGIIIQIFLATADSGNTSIIWKWDPEEEQYNLFQNISTNNAFHWKYFVIDNRSFLVVANFGGNKSGKTYSNVYRWHPKKRRFIVRQHMITHGARSWEHFEISGDNFLVVANSADPIGSKIRRLSVQKINILIYHFRRR